MEFKVPASFKTMQFQTIVFVLVILLVGQTASKDSCVEQLGKCEGSKKCCSVKHGRAFCNTNTKKCEASRFCEEGKSCPFDDLSPGEVNATIEVIRTSSKFEADIQFPIIRRQEPAKADWNALKTKGEVKLAYGAVFDPKSNLMSTVVVDLGQKSIVSVEPQPTKLPPVLDSEDEDAKALFLADPRVKEAYERRGLNFSHADCAAWAIGALGPESHPPGSRLLRLVSSYQPPDEKDYSTWHPLEGLEVTIDLNSKKILSFFDDPTVPAPPAVKILESSESDHKSKSHKLKPLHITQPKGTSFKVKGQEVSWYKWKFQYSMDYVHGLQLFHVRYHGDCEERLVLYKMSISEIFVPYGPTAPRWSWRNSFDAGEYGLGRFSTPLVLGVDVPENAALINCTFANDANGEPLVRTNCIGIYERDGGVLYKHTKDDEKNLVNGKRGRDLVITFTASVGNDDYAFYYIFKMDGEIDVNVKPTGIMLPQGVSSAKNEETCIDSCVNYATENLVPPVHQHFFNYRLDFDVDGPINSVLEVDVVEFSGPSEDPADLEAFSVKKKLLKTETGRDWSFKNSRTWQIVNPNSRNKFGSVRGYSITPSTIPVHSYLDANGPLHAQAQFVTHQFWATVYKDDEQGAAGEFPRSGEPGQGLPTYVRNEESLENTDVVAWYTVGMTHSPKPENWPIMSTRDAGFRITPVNFMSHNPEILLSSFQC